MAAAQPARFGAPGDDIADWMARRWRDIANLGPEAENAGRRLWAQATRSGQDVAAPNPSDVSTLGAQYLRGGTANADSAPQKQDASSQSPTSNAGGNSADSNDWSDYPQPGGYPLSPPSFGRGGLLQLAASPYNEFWDTWCANCHGPMPGILPPNWGRRSFPRTTVRARAPREVLLNRNGAINRNAISSISTIGKPAKKPGLQRVGQIVPSGWATAIKPARSAFLCWGLEGASRSASATPVIEVGTGPLCEVRMDVGRKGKGGDRRLVALILLDPDVEEAPHRTQASDCWGKGLFRQVQMRLEFRPKFVREIPVELPDPFGPLPSKDGLWTEWRKPNSH